MRVYRVRRAAGVARDLDLIEDYLAEAYQGFGDDPASATARAALRVEEALLYLRSFETHPHRGTERPEIRPGVRTVTSNRFIVYFEIDEPKAEVRMLAVFFGGIDYTRQIMDRLRH